jgi:hypothetical protein
MVNGIKKKLNELKDKYLSEKMKVPNCNLVMHYLLIEFPFNDKYLLGMVIF